MLETILRSTCLFQFANANNFVGGHIQLLRFAVIPHRDIVLNPAVIIEVLSEAAGEFDRGVKFMSYRNVNDTLTDYVLVSQDEPHIEHYIRRKNGDWLLKEYYGLEKSSSIDSINCALKLSEIYERAEFED